MSKKSRRSRGEACPRPVPSSQVAPAPARTPAFTVVNNDPRIALINHLSADIVSQTAAMVTWRSRINFASYFGPWIVFGGYFAGLGAIPVLPEDQASLWIAVGTLVVMYLILGLACGWVEYHVWDQQNLWRETIRKLSAGGDASQEDLFFPQSLRLQYILVYILMLITLIAGIVVLTELTPDRIRVGR
jgi:hypothetical protein